MAVGHTAKSSRRDLGKLRTRPRQRGQHRTADRLAERAGERRVFIPFVPAGRLLLRVSAPMPIRGRRVWEEFPGRLLLTRQRQHPCGASGLGGDPTPAAPRIYSITLPTHPLNQDIRASVGSPARTGGSAARSAAERELATGAADLLSAGHSPHPLACSAGPFLPIMRGRRPASFAARPGALGVSP